MSSSEQMDSSVALICLVSSFSLLWNIFTSWGAKSPPSLNNLQKEKTHPWRRCLTLKFSLPVVPGVTWRSLGVVLFCIWPLPVWSEVSVWRWSDSVGCVWYVYPDSPSGWSSQPPDCKETPIPAINVSDSSVFISSVRWPRIGRYRLLLSAIRMSSSMLDRATVNCWFFLPMEVCSSCISVLQEVNTCNMSPQWASTHCRWSCSSAKTHRKTWLRFCWWGLRYSGLNKLLVIFILMWVSHKFDTNSLTRQWSLDLWSQSQSRDSKQIQSCSAMCDMKLCHSLLEFWLKLVCKQPCQAVLDPAELCAER